MNSSEQPNPASTQPAPAPQPQPAAGDPKTNVMAIFALIFSFILPLVGIVLAAVALGQIKKRGEGGKAAAIAALIISIIMFIVSIVVLLIVGFAAIAGVQKQTSTFDSNSTSSGSSTQSKNYSADEQKAVSNAQDFLSAIKSGNYTAAYNLMGPELKKEYKDANDFANQAKDKNLNLIKSWEVTTVTTSSSGETITVKGTLKANGSNSNGTFEFGYYKDTDGSINMLSYELSPS